MFVNYRYFNFCLFILIVTFLLSTALFCSDLTLIDDKDTPCFLESSTDNPIVLRTSGNGLILPCHVARSQHADVEWWYTDSQNLMNIKIYPVYSTVRPIALRFITHLTDTNETDITDASILLRHVNIDDSGIYRCVIRPWTMDPLQFLEDTFSTDDSDSYQLMYEVQITAPRLCHSNPDMLPCFSAMRTSSPTVIDVYQTGILQCLVKNYNRRINVFWVAGNASTDDLLINDYLTINEYQGDQFHRMFPFSPFDYSIEITLNQTIYERVYSCIIKGDTDIETTIFTYIIRNIDVNQIDNKYLNTTNNEENIVVYDDGNHEENHSLQDDTAVLNDEEYSLDDDTFELNEEDETSTTI